MSQASIIQSLINKISRTLRVAMPGIIEQYDFKTQKADIKIDMQELLHNNSTIDYPLLTNVPVIFPRSGGASVTLPVNRGDSCLIFFLDRDMDKWKEGNGDKIAASMRSHSLNDAVAIVGLMSFSKEQVAVNNTDLLIQYDGSRIFLKPNGLVEIESAKTIDVKTDNVIINCKYANINGSEKITTNCRNLEINAHESINVNCNNTNSEITPTVNVTVNDTAVIINEDVSISCNNANINAKENINLTCGEADGELIPEIDIGLNTYAQNVNIGVNNTLLTINENVNISCNEDVTVNCNNVSLTAKENASIDCNNANIECNNVGVTAGQNASINCNEASIIATSVINTEAPNFIQTGNLTIDGNIEITGTAEVRGKTTFNADATCLATLSGSTVQTSGYFGVNLATHTHGYIDTLPPESAGVGLPKPGSTGVPGGI